MRNFLKLFRHYSRNILTNFGLETITCNSKKLMIGLSFLEKEENRYFIQVMMLSSIVQTIFYIKSQNAHLRFIVPKIDLLNMNQIFVLYIKSLIIISEILGSLKNGKILKISFNYLYHIF